MAASRAPSGSSNPNALPNPAVDLASRLAVARAMAPVIEGQHSQAPVAEALGIPVHDHWNRRREAVCHDDHRRGGIVGYVQPSADNCAAGRNLHCSIVGGG